MRELDDVLPTIEPPGGGLARLQRRIASQRRTGHTSRIGRWAWVATACAALVVAAVLVQPWIARQQRTQAFAGALRAAMTSDQPSDGIRVANGGAIELPSGQRNVRLYLVQTARTTGGK